MALLQLGELRRVPFAGFRQEGDLALGGVELVLDGADASLTTEALGLLRGGDPALGLGEYGGGSMGGEVWEVCVRVMR